MRAWRYNNWSNGDDDNDPGDEFHFKHQNNHCGNSTLSQVLAVFSRIGELIKFKLLLDRGTVEYKMCILGSPW